MLLSRRPGKQHRYFVSCESNVRTLESFTLFLFAKTISKRIIAESVKFKIKILRILLCVSRSPDKNMPTSSC